LLKLCGDRIRIYGGDDATARQLLLEGGHGNISVTANLVPDQMHRMCALAMQGHADGALAIDATLAGLHDLLFVEGNPVPVKWAMATLGMIGPGIRLPLVELSAGFHGVLSDAMRKAGLLK
jgi:4-hydroxy-tetrahydrodipicolinate synthase